MATGNTSFVKMLHPQAEQYFLWNQITTDAAGEAVGPIVTVAQVPTMLSFQRINQVQQYITSYINRCKPSSHAYDDFLDVVSSYRVR